MKNIIISTKNIDLSKELMDYIHIQSREKILPKIEEDIKIKFLIQKTNTKDYQVDIDIRVENIKIHNCEKNIDLNQCIKNCINEISYKVGRINKKIEKKNYLKNKKQINKFCDDIFINSKNQYLNELDIFSSTPICKNEDEIEFAKYKKLTLKPMTPIEAVLQMNLVNHHFFIFLNADTNEKAVVYKRDDGRYGIIE